MIKYAKRFNLKYLSYAHLFENMINNRNIKYVHAEYNTMINQYFGKLNNLLKILKTSFTINKK